jgi:hypothetical protein
MTGGAISYYGYPSSGQPGERSSWSLPRLRRTAFKQVYNDLGFTVRVRSLYADSSKLAHDVALDVPILHQQQRQPRDLNIRADHQPGRAGAARPTTASCSSTTTPTAAEPATA